MKIAIHQPNYLPYPGFFAKLHLSDIFVIYDTAQFTRGDFINRNRIRTFSFNGYMWLTLPVGKRNFKGVAIKNVDIVDEGVFSKHSKTLEIMYSKASFFDKEICKIVKISHMNLAEHNVFIIEYLLDKLDLNRPRIILASELGIRIRRGTHGLVDIVKALGGDEYVSGTGVKAYLNEGLFRRQSITLSFIDCEPLNYPQIHPGFVENMSVLDAIFNMGWKETCLRLRGARTQKVLFTNE